jgi:hypothetical protein
VPERSRERGPKGDELVKNIENHKRALFFVEMDMGTERVVSQITRDKRISLFHKLSQYDQQIRRTCFSTAQ